MDENIPKTDTRSAKTSNQQALVPTLKMLTDDGIHSDAASSDVAASGGSGAASDDIPNVKPAMKSTTVAAFTKAFANEERDATASRYPSADSRRSHPGARPKKVKEPLCLQIDNQDLSVTSEEIMRKTDLCNMPQPFCTNCITIMNDQESEEGWHETCKKKELTENENHDKISMLIDTDNNQEFIGMREELNQLRKNETVHQDIVMKMKEKISNLEQAIEKYINQQLCNKALRVAIDRQEIAMKNLKISLQNEIEITKKRKSSGCSAHK